MVGMRLVVLRDLGRVHQRFQNLLQGAPSFLAGGAECPALLPCVLCGCGQRLSG